MPKNRSRSGARQPIRPVVRPAQAGQAGAVPGMGAAPARTGGAVGPGPRNEYIAGDLKSIAIISGAMFVILIVLNFFL